MICDDLVVTVSGPPTNVTGALTNVSMNDVSLVVTWMPPPCRAAGVELRGHIREYLLHYCASDEHNNCLSKITFKYYIVVYNG